MRAWKGLFIRFSGNDRLPPSLRNVLTELRADLGVTRTRGDLSDWARQGVLLMNTSLSVLPRAPGSHAGMRWERLARQAVASAQENGPLAFVLWGAHARRAVGDLVRDVDLLVESAHPSPLSAHRGFFGSRPFGRVNAWLAERGEPEIVWA